MSHELPSQSDWITRASRTLVHLGFVPSLALVTVMLVPVFAMLAPLLVLLLAFYDRQPEVPSTAQQPGTEQPATPAPQAPTNPAPQRPPNSTQ